MSKTADEIDHLYEQLKENLHDQRDSFRAGFLVGLRWLAHGANGVSEEVEESFDLKLDLTSWNIDSDD